MDGAGFAAPAAIVEYDRDGALLLRHALALEGYDRQVGDWLRRWAGLAPERVALGEWAADGHLHTITYAELRTACDRLSQALLDRGLGPDRPVAFLSEKNVAQALLTLAALQVGIPVCPISPAYSLRPEARGRLGFCLGVVRPGLVLVDDATTYAAALAMLPPGTEIVTDAALPAMGRDPMQVGQAFEQVDPDGVAKILFTSGSTGDPKPVINTHRMMCSNAAAQAQLFPFLRHRPPVVVDWQPWHHCGGSSHNFHAALSNGGSYYFDRGKPTTTEAFAPTLHALRSISPTLHFNVPLGYDRLAFDMGRDPALARAFFARLDCIVYSAASMPETLWAELERLSVATRGDLVPMVSSYGMTEMAPLHTSLHWHEGAPGRIGLPIPGSTVKLVPSGDRLELRAKGPNVTPGYYTMPALTEAAFDAEGWYCSGDAVRLVDPTRPERGLQFEGRLTDQFKLATGSWVPIGAIRTAIVAACSPLVDDVLVAGEGKSELGVLVVPNQAACQALFGPLSLAELIVLPALAERLRSALRVYNAANPASSRRIARALAIDDLPSLATGETTDKGHVNQALALRRRPGLVARLFADADAHVLRL